MAETINYSKEDSLIQQIKNWRTLLEQEPEGLQPYIEGVGKDQQKIIDIMKSFISLCIIDESTSGLEGSGNLDKAYELAEKNLVTVFDNHQGRFATVGLPYLLYTFYDKIKILENTVIYPRISLYAKKLYRAVLPYLTMSPLASSYVDLPHMNGKEKRKALINSKKGINSVKKNGDVGYLFPEGGTPRIKETYQGEEYDVLIPFVSVDSFFLQKDKKGENAGQDKYAVPQIIDGTGDVWGYRESFPALHLLKKNKHSIKLRTGEPVSSTDLETEKNNGQFNDGFEIYKNRYKGYILRQCVGQFEDSFKGTFPSPDKINNPVLFSRIDLEYQDVIKFLEEFYNFIEKDDFYENTDKYIIQIIEYVENYPKEGIFYEFMSKNLIFLKKVLNKIVEPKHGEFAMWIRLAAMHNPGGRGELGRDCLKALSKDEITYLKTQIADTCRDDDWLKPPNFSEEYYEQAREDLRLGSRLGQGKPTSSQSS